MTLNVQQMKEVASDRFNISVVMPTGSTLENTDKIVKVLEERLEDFRKERSDLPYSGKRGDSDTRFAGRLHKDRQTENS